MPGRRTLNLLFVLHSWAGLVTGLLLFVVCFSGAIVVFKHEIDLWANPALSRMPRVAAPVTPDVVMAELARRHPQAQVETLVLPDDVMPVYMAYVRLAPDAGGVRTKLALRADTGALIGPVESQLGQYIRMLHVFLFFGPRWIVGFLGVAMLVLIGTGFVIHRKIVAELFTQRWDRSLRVVMSDLHKSAGVWALAFHVLIAFTGAWLGLAPVFERGWDYVARAASTSATASSAAAPWVAATGEGAVPKAPRAKGPAAGAERPSKVSMASIAAIDQAAREAIPGFQPKAFSLQKWGRPDATVSVTGGLAEHLHSTASARFSGATGALLKAQDPRRQGFWSQFNGLMEPLHFGDFGGIGLKWLYFLLGLTPAFLSLSGTVIWLDSRRQREAARQRALARNAPQGATA